MANINAADQIAFCNNVVRVGANLLGQSYTSCKSRLQRWQGLGSGASALAAMTSPINEIRNTANFIILNGVWDFCQLAERTWFLKGTTTYIPNDGASLILDGPGGGTQDSGRPPINAANVNIVVAQLISFRQWLQNDSFTTTGTAGDFANHNNILQVSSNGPPGAMGLSDATNFMNRCNDLVTQYEANSSNILNNILVAATNPSLIT